MFAIGYIHSTTGNPLRRTDFSLRTPLGRVWGLHEEDEFDAEQFAEKLGQQRASMEATSKARRHGQDPSGDHTVISQMSRTASGWYGFRSKKVIRTHCKMTGNGFGDVWCDWTGAKGEVLALRAAILPEIQPDRDCLTHVCLGSCYCPCFLDTFLFAVLVTLLFCLSSCFILVQTAAGSNEQHFEGQPSLSVVFLRGWLMCILMLQVFKQMCPGAGRGIVALNSVWMRFLNRILYF